MNNNIIEDIEERARNSTYRHHARAVESYIEGAIEQDAIARKEEREKCLNLALYSLCVNSCINYRVCHLVYGDNMDDKCLKRLSMIKCFENER